MNTLCDELIQMIVVEAAELKGVRAFATVVRPLVVRPKGNNNHNFSYLPHVVLSRVSKLFSSIVESEIRRLAQNHANHIEFLTFHIASNVSYLSGMILNDA